MVRLITEGQEKKFENADQLYEHARTAAQQGERSFGLRARTMQEGIDLLDVWAKLKAEFPHLTAG